MRRPTAPRLTATQLEPREVPATFTGESSAVVAVAPDDGGRPVVRLVDVASGKDVASVAVYEDSFRGGVHAALGDVTGDGVRELVVAPGKGGGPRLRILDGVSGGTLADFFVYEPTYTGGVYVALGDVNADGRADIVTGTGDGGGPRVRVLDGATLGQTVLKDFFAYEDSFRGGVQVAAGDMNGDGRADIATGTGVGGGPRVRVFDAATDAVVQDFFAYEDSFRGGVNVAVGTAAAGGTPLVLTGSGVGGGPVVRAFAGNGRMVSNILADDPAFRGGVRVDAVRLAGAAADTLVAQVRKGDSEVVRLFDTGGAVLGGAVRQVDSTGAAPATVALAGLAARYVADVSAADAGTVSLRLLGGETVAVRTTAATQTVVSGVAAALRSGDLVTAEVAADGTATRLSAVRATTPAETSTATPTEAPAAAPTDPGTSPAPVEDEETPADTGSPTGGASSGGGSVTPVSPANPGPSNATPPADPPPAQEDPVTAAGTITAVSTNARTVSLLDTEGVQQTITLAAATVVTKDGVVVGLDAILPDDLAEVRTGSDGAVSRLDAFTRPPTPSPALGGGNGRSGGFNPGPDARIEGVVASVNTADRALVVRNSRGVSFVIRVTDATVIERNRVPVDFDAIQPGDPVVAITDSTGAVTRLELTGA